MSGAKSKDVAYSRLPRDEDDDEDILSDKLFSSDRRLSKRRMVAVVTLLGVVCLVVVAVTAGQQSNADNDASSAEKVTEAGEARRQPSAEQPLPKAFSSATKVRKNSSSTV
jgi:type VI protein secretion system component VasF